MNALGYMLKLPTRLCKTALHQHFSMLSSSALIQLHSSRSASVRKPYCTKGTQKHTSTYALMTHSESNVQSLSLNSDSKTCYIKWLDGFHTEFHSIWLRHNCHCEVCRHKTGQRLVDPASISASIHIDSISSEGNSLRVKWTGVEGSHEGFIPYSYLRSHNYNKETILARRQSVKCVKSVKTIPIVTLKEITTSKIGLLRWLQYINEDGICLVKDVPLEDCQVAKVAELVGPVASTIYGTTFDVKATEDPINVAYSDLHIGLHMDLVYYESPPGLQLLHCLKFDECVEGGKSIFLDVFSVADEFRVTYPDLFHVLTTVPATFQKVHYDRDYPVHIMSQKPHIRLNHLGEIVAIYWAPPFEGPLSVAGEDVEPYYRAYEMFAKMIQDSPHTPGELVVFNNLRMLHGRGHFISNGGMRHLKGCYVNIDVFKSMTQVLSNLVGDGRLAKRVGNQCWF